MKKSIRRDTLKKRNSLKKEIVISKSRAIKKKLFSSDEYKKSKVVCFYVSFGSEVDTIDMIKESLKKKKVCVPVVEEDKIILSIIKNFNELNNKNKYDILEPSAINNINKHNVDLMIVPGVAFDKQGYRIGYGMGYYDKLLKGFKGKKIGLGFKVQVVDKIPAEEHDIKVDKVISE